jgi:hypothetical protein
MEALKAFVEFLATYPVWAKAVSALGLMLTVGVLVFAPHGSEGAKAAKLLDAVTERLAKKLGERPLRTGRVYPLLGLGLRVPSIWVIEDAATRFGGGDVSLIKRYEETKAAVGVKLCLRSVQRNYITDRAAEEANQMDVLRPMDATPPETSRFNVGTREGTVFHYYQSTGKRRGEIKMFWVRLIPEVKLEIVAMIYADSGDRDEFWKEVDEIVQSLVLDDDDVFEARAKTLRQ